MPFGNIDCNNSSSDELSESISKLCEKQLVSTLKDLKINFNKLEIPRAKAEN